MHCTSEIRDFETIGLRCREVSYQASSHDLFGFPKPTRDNWLEEPVRSWVSSQHFSNQCIFGRIVTKATLTQKIKVLCSTSSSVASEKDSQHGMCTQGWLFPLQCHYLYWLSRNCHVSMLRLKMWAAHMWKVAGSGWRGFQRSADTAKQMMLLKNVMAAQAMKVLWKTQGWGNIIILNTVLHDVKFSIISCWLTSTATFPGSWKLSSWCSTENLLGRSNIHPVVLYL